MESKLKMQTVVETPTYLKAAVKLFSAEEREEIVAMVASDPECGEVIQGPAAFGRFVLVAAAWVNGVVRE